MTNILEDGRVYGGVLTPLDPSGSGDVTSVNGQTGAVNLAPADLGIYDATPAQKGLIKIASDEDVASGTDEEKAINSKQLRENINAIDNITVNSFSSGVIVSSLGTSPADNEIPTAKAVADDIDANVGQEVTITADGVLAGNVITFTTQTVLKHGQKVEFDLSFTGEFSADGTDKMVITDGINTFKINNILMQDATTSITTAPMRQCATFDGTSYRWHFTGKVKIDEPNFLIYLIPTVVNYLGFVRYYPLLMTNSEMLNAETDGMYYDYKIINGQKVICNDDNGYSNGHTYIFRIDNAEPENPVYSWTDAYGA